MYIYISLDTDVLVVNMCPLLGSKIVMRHLIHDSPVTVEHKHNNSYISRFT